MSPVLEALLTAHVEHEMARWRGEALTQTFEHLLSEVFVWLADVKVDEVATRAQIMGVIDRYVINLRVSGGITELVGEMARLVFTSKSSAGARIDQVLPPAAYEEFAEKIVGLESVRRELISLVAHSATFGTVTSRIISRALIELMFRREHDKAAPLVAGLAGVTARVSAAVLPELERRVGGLIGRYLAQHRARITHDAERHLLEVLDTDCLRAVADEIWDALSHMPLADAFAFIGEQDLEDFVVLGFEFWLKFRKTPFFYKVLVEEVDYFFVKYGDESVLTLIEDMGVSESMVRYEVLNFLGPLLEHATKTGFFEQQLRAHLASFYRSPAAAAALEQLSATGE